MTGPITLPEPVDSTAALRRLADLTAAEWEARIASWQDGEPIVLLDESADLLCRAVCTWAGVPLADEQEPTVTDLLTDLIEAPGALGVPYWRGRLARARADRWAGAMIEAARADPAAPAATDRVVRHLRSPGVALLPGGSRPAAAYRRRPRRRRAVRAGGAPVLPVLPVRRRASRPRVRLGR